MIFEWQKAAWTSLGEKRKNLSHALLVLGPAGVGKSALADTFAQSLLCERPNKDGLPCGTCQACNWYTQGNHPDFRRIQPESMAPESEDEPPSRKEKKKSDQIKIEQVRALDDFLAVGTHRGGARVILIDPADAMNNIAQSALLKSLEEPPPGTHYLLVTSRPQRLLATIRSRCTRCPVALPDRDAAVSWLAGEGVNGAGPALDAAAGAPLAALAAAGAEEARKAFLARLADPAMDPLSLAQACESVEPAILVGWLQRWTYDLLSTRTSGRIRYHAEARTAIEKLAQSAQAASLAGLLRRLGEARALAQHPLNARLFYEDLLLQYRGALGAAGQRR